MLIPPFQLRFQGQNTPPPSGQSPYVGMSHYIPNVSQYHRVEEDHAGWKEGMSLMKSLISAHRNDDGQKLSILEFGPGAGNSTEILAEIPNAEIDAVEVDQNYFQELCKNTQQKGLKNVFPILGDVNRVKTQNKRYDAICGMFAITQLSEDKMQQFLQRCRDHLLKRDGVLVIGNEFLPSPGGSLALARHHSNVIFKAIKDRKPELAHMELDAWQAGEHKVGSFKTSCEEFERRLENAGFTGWKKWRIWPGPEDEKRLPFQLPEGGVYVYKAWIPTHNDKRRFI